MRAASYQLKAFPKTMTKFSTAAHEEPIPLDESEEQEQVPILVDLREQKKEIEPLSVPLPLPLPLPEKEVDMPKFIPHFVLDGLSTIIKLAILSKQSNAKMYVYSNRLCINSSGMWQALTRWWNNYDHSDLHHLLNPIFFACTSYHQYQLKPIIDLAILGLNKLIALYESDILISQMLSFYIKIMETSTPSSKHLFTADKHTKFYEVINKRSVDYWNQNRVATLLNIFEYEKDKDFITLHTFMDNVDLEFAQIVSEFNK